MAGKIGTVGCLCCGERIPVKVSAGGAMSVCCPWCDLSAYAKAGTQAYARIEARMEKERAPEPAPSPEPAPKPAQKPEAKQKPSPKREALPWEQ